MIKGITTVILLTSELTLVAATYSCSSSGTPTNGNDAGAPDSGPHSTIVDSGMGEGSSASSPDSATDGAVDASDAAGDDANDANEEPGPTCPSIVTAADIPPASWEIGAMTTRGVCTTAQIATAIQSCYVDGPTSAECKAFGDPDAGNVACAACAVPVNVQGNFFSQGPIWVTASGLTYANVPGCLVQTATTGTSAAATKCATDESNRLECEDLACASCNDFESEGANWMACANAQPSPSCASFAASQATDCATLLGDGGTGVECENAAFVIGVYCGGASEDAGVPVDDGG